MKKLQCGLMLLVVMVVSSPESANAQWLNLYSDMLSYEEDDHSILFWAVGSAEDSGCPVTVDVNPYLIGPDSSLLTETWESGECYAFGIAQYVADADSILDGLYQAFTYAVGWVAGCGNASPVQVSQNNWNYQFLGQDPGDPTWAGYGRCNPGICAVVNVKRNRFGPGWASWPPYARLRVFVTSIPLPFVTVRECHVTNAFVQGGCYPD
jgi:hypothetical protein